LLRQENLELEAKVAHAEANAQKARYDCEDARKKRDDALNSVLPLTTQVDSGKQQIQNLTRQVGEFKAAADKHKADADKYRGDAERYLAAGRVEQQRRRTAESDLATIRTQVAKAAADAQTAADEAKVRENNLAAALAAAEKDRDETQGKLDGIRGDRDALAGQVEQLKGQIENVTQQDGQVWNVPVGREPPFVPLSDRRRPTPVISVLNLKGGVGKTTITANLGGHLALDRGKRVLLLDFDHQRSLTQLLLSTKDRRNAALAGKTYSTFCSTRAEVGWTCTRWLRRYRGSMAAR
jgi:predicted  nucleic acid-binding Zn-ribbon protein